MENILSLLNQLVDTVEVWGVVVIVITSAAFLVQLYYLLIVYARIPAYRRSKMRSSEHVSSNGGEGVSLIVVLRNSDFSYIENTLPRFLSQDYAKFEIVLVNLSDDEDFSEILAVFAENNPRISVTRFTRDPRFEISNKMALNVGIKAARYENILFTTTECAPVSDRWLSLMARGFDDGDVVVGYCGIEPAKGFANRFMRIDQLGVSVRRLARAMKGKTYAGTICNMGFTKEVYFANQGFNYLNINAGEDSLFLGKIATPDNTAVVSTPNSIVRRRVWGGLKWWWEERKFHGYAHRYFSCGVKLYIGAELWSRVVFFAGAVAIIIFMPLEFLLFGAGLLLVRFAVMMFECNRICRRLSEPGLFVITPLYDLVAPFYEAALMISRRIKPSQGLWKR